MDVIDEEQGYAYAKVFVEYFGGEIPLDNDGLKQLMEETKDKVLIVHEENYYVISPQEVDEWEAS